MSTNNFSYDNILVVIPDFCLYDESGEFIEYDDFSFDEYIGEMQSLLSKIGFSDCNKSDGDRNYSGRIISEYSIYDTFGNQYKTISIIIRSGYYDGQNIDYTIEDGYTDSKKTKTMDSKIDKKALQVEKLLKKHGGEQYIKTAQFSNGEAMYQKLSKITK